MQDLIVAAISATSMIIVAFIQASNKKHAKEQENVNNLRSKESKLSMDMMYACCVLSKGTANALKNNHFNSEVERGIELVDKATDEYNKFLRETAADTMSA